jgi:hypothetical protein
LESFTFNGILDAEKVIGDLMIITLLDPLPSLKVGTSRIDKFSISQSVSYAVETINGQKIESLSLKTAPTNLMEKIITIDVVPYFRENSDGAESKDKYGICSNEGCIWLAWKINSSGGSLIFGICTDESLIHPDASVEANDGTWTYSVTGQASHGYDLRACEIAEEGDIISINIDTTK